MKVDSIFDWFGRPLKEGKFAGPGPFEVTGQDLMDLLENWDVAVWHCKQPQPSRRERAKGAQPVPDTIVIALDTKGGKHRQR